MSAPQISVRTGTIGPRHDPYGTTLVTVKRDGRKAEFYEDGLGTRRLWLGDLNRHEDCVREEEWHDYAMTGKLVNRERCQMVKANILFRRWVGLTIDEAMAEFDRTWQADPMGSLARYE